jgi:hypothetical protein
MYLCRSKENFRINTFNLAILESVLQDLTLLEWT